MKGKKFTHARLGEAAEDLDFSDQTVLDAAKEKGKTKGWDDLLCQEVCSPRAMTFSGGNVRKAGIGTQMGKKLMNPSIWNSKQIGPRLRSLNIILKNHNGVGGEKGGK